MKRSKFRYNLFFLDGLHEGFAAKSIDLLTTKVWIQSSSSPCWYMVHLLYAGDRVGLKEVWLLCHILLFVLFSNLKFMPQYRAILLRGTINAPKITSYWTIPKLLIMPPHIKYSKRNAFMRPTTSKLSTASDTTDLQKAAVSAVQILRHPTNLPHYPHRSILMCIEMTM